MKVFLVLMLAFNSVLLGANGVIALIEWLLFHTLNGRALFQAAVGLIAVVIFGFLICRIDQ